MKQAIATLNVNDFELDFGIATTYCLPHLAEKLLSQSIFCKEHNYYV